MFSTFVTSFSSEEPNPAADVLLPVVEQVRAQTALEHVFVVRYAELLPDGEPSIAVPAGFQSTVLPIIAGEPARLPPIAVKLNGEIASTKPSSGRCSRRFHTPGDDCGCSW